MGGLRTGMSRFGALTETPGRRWRNSLSAGLQIVEDGCMAGQALYQWDYIAPFATVKAYVHGYGDRTAQTFSIVPFQYESASGLTQRVTLTQGSVKRHVDGTVARELWVKNETFWAVVV